MAEVEDHPEPTSTQLNERPGMPRWVKVSLIVVAALVVVLLAAKATGLGGDHGPGRHGGRDTPAPVVDEDGGHRPPVDHRP